MAKLASKIRAYDSLNMRHRERYSKLTTDNDLRSLPGPGSCTFLFCCHKSWLVCYIDSLQRNNAFYRLRQQYTIILNEDGINSTFYLPRKLPNVSNIHKLLLGTDRFLPRRMGFKDYEVPVQPVLYF